MKTETMIETTLDLSTIEGIDLSLMNGNDKRFSSLEEKRLRAFNIIVDMVFTEYSFLGVNRNQVFDYGRKKDVIFIRHMIMYLCHVVARQGTTEISRRFKGKAKFETLDHSTVNNAVLKIGYRMDVERDFKKSFTELKNLVSERLKNMEK
jgi:chromosomal replication initiation ATPase DnaA